MSAGVELLGNSFTALRVRNYRLYFFGHLVSMIGTWVQVTAKLWLVLQLTGSATSLGVVSSLEFAPMLLIGAWGGNLADRFDKRHVLLVTQSALASLAVLLGTLTLLDVVTLPMIYVIALITGFVRVVDVPTRHSFLGEMVASSDLPNAVGLNSAIFTGARVIGPALGGLMISTAGIGWAFLVNAASFGALLIAVARMDVGTLIRDGVLEGARGSVLEGLTYVWSRPILRDTIVLLATLSILSLNFSILLPAIAHDVFQGGATAYGFLSSSQGVGAFLGALLAAARPRPTRNYLLLISALLGIAILLVGTVPTLLLAVLAVVPVGMLVIVFVSTANAILQLNSPLHLRGRMMALYSVVFLGTVPLGAPLTGWIAEGFGPRVAYVLAGVSALTAACIAAWPVLRERVHERRANAGYLPANVFALRASEASSVEVEGVQPSATSPHPGGCASSLRPPCS